MRVQRNEPDLATASDPTSLVHVNSAAATRQMVDKKRKIFLSDSSTSCTMTWEALRTYLPLR